NEPRKGIGYGKRARPTSENKEDLIMCIQPATTIRNAPGILVTSVLLTAILLAAGLSLSACRSTDSSATVAASDVPPLAARVDRLDGDVGTINQTQAGQAQPASFIKAGVNTPVSVGTRLYVKSGSRSAVAFSGRNYARLNPNTSV